MNHRVPEFARVPCSEAGALETLVMALRLHRMDPDIAWLDFAALRNMCMAGKVHPRSDDDTIPQRE